MFSLFRLFIVPFAASILTFLSITIDHFPFNKNAIAINIIMAHFEYSNCSEKTGFYFLLHILDLNVLAGLS